MRKLMWFTLGFAAGCALCAYCYGAWLSVLLLIAAVAAAVTLVLTLRFRRVRIFCAVTLGLAAGLALFLLYDSFYLCGARSLDGQTARATVIVTDYSYQTEYGSAVDGRITLGEQDYTVRLYLDEEMALEPGNRVSCRMKFRFTSSGGIEDVLYHRGKGMFLLAYQQGDAVVERCRSTPGLCYPAVWRQTLRECLDESLPRDVSGFAKALLLGDRTDIDYETNTVFKVSGISHIIAVSGLHISILYGLVSALTGKRKWATAILGIPVILLFAAIAGFTPSVTRAAVMCCMMMLARLLRREYDGPTELAFSALVMLVWNPLVITSVSFQLSFACMAGIMLFREPIQSWLLSPERMGRWKSRAVRSICSSVALSLSANIMTIPLAAVYFGTVSLIGIVTNIAVLWVISFVFYGLMAICLLGALGLPTAILGNLIAWPIRYVLWISRLLAEFPLAAVYTQCVYIVVWLVGLYVLLAVFLAMKKKPVGLFASLAVCSLLFAVGLAWAEPYLSDCTVTVLDVGEGQSVILQAGGKTFLVDCGGDYDDDAADIAAETLLSQGIRRLDGIILTHYDRDHTGGLQNLLTRMDADVILLPFCADQNGITQMLEQQCPEILYWVKEDTSLTYEGAEIMLFAPESYNSGNESCMCILFSAGNCDILITGDRGEAGERLLLKYHELPDVDVLVAGHHGAATSTGQALLDAVRPEYVLISAGLDNDYGHPAQDLLVRLEEFGCAVFRTDEDGTIRYRG